VAVEIIILSVLRAGPVHGYELKRRVQRTTLTSLSNNSLYPVLRRFEEAGAVTKTIEEQGGKPDRKVYTITDAGRRMLTELISTLPLKLATSEEEFLVRVSFFHELSPAQRLGILDARAAVLDGGIAQVRALIGESDKSPTREWRNLSMVHLVERFESERQWIADLTTKAGT
jgi:DNA-binding PadR family transcriptional regulator